MKLDLHRESFATALAIVATVIPSNNAKPVLKTVMVQVKSDNVVTLTTTDCEITISYTLKDATVSGRGEFLFPARRVSDVIKELRDERITLDVESELIRIVAKTGVFRIPSQSVFDFPQPAAFVEAGVSTVAGNLLKKMIRRTVLATDEESARYALQGVLFVFTHQLTAVATDSRRMSLISAPSDLNGEPPNKPIVPAKALSLVDKTVPDSADVVHVSFGTSQARFKTANAEITTQLVEGKFPRYEDVIPKNNREVLISAGDLYGLVRQAAVMTTEESRGVDFRFGEGELTLHSQAADVGDSLVNLPISYTGESVVVRLDPRFVIEYLRTLPSESLITFEFTDEETPILIKTTDGGQYVVMPLSREG